jgi:hypothetical protein
MRCAAGNFDPSTGAGQGWKLEVGAVGEKAKAARKNNRPRSLGQSLLGPDQ